MRFACYGRLELGRPVELGDLFRRQAEDRRQPVDFGSRKGVCKIRVVHLGEQDVLHRDQPAVVRRDAERNAQPSRFRDYWRAP